MPVPISVSRRAVVITRSDGELATACADAPPAGLCGSALLLALSLSLSLSLSGVMGWQFLQTRGFDVAGWMTRANSTDMTQSQ